ncbi:restriction endonuclease subunit S [Trujillonella endophytica]|uniref:Type I restriction enzyme, S subunit n=1 Tax=Trujillonella endophytica TaxID=673521 RepID=A0A1H8VI89_9ACTN|nr:restriction endonuclease subunit S [Trujillella endophytica]SEP15023.1 type I restriction enzyme, S subunit [Trujillella endophytica]
MIRLRYLADVNPSCPAFETLGTDEQVTFMPLESVWADERLDLTRTRRKSETATGYVRFQEGDILVPKVTPTFQAGRSAIVPRLANGVGAGSTELHVLRAREGADARFICYATQTSRFLTEGVSRFQGVAGLQRVPELFIRDFSVPDHALGEQRRIADFLDQQIPLLDRAVELRMEQAALLRERQRAGVALLLSGTSTASQTVIHPVLGPVNAAWPILRLKRTVQRAGVGVVVNPSSYFVEDGGVPFIHGGNVREGAFDLTNVKRISAEDSDALHRSRLAPGDVVVVRAGYPGRAAVVPEHLSGSNCASVLLFTPNDAVEPKWLETFFNSEQGRSQVRLVQYGAAQEQINLGDVVEFVLPVPSRDEQRLFMRELQEKQDDLVRLDRLISESVTLLRERKRALISAAVMGEFDVTTARSAA